MKKRINFAKPALGLLITLNLFGCLRESNQLPVRSTTIQNQLNTFNLNSKGLPFGNTSANIAKILNKPYDGTIRFVLLGDNRNSSPFSKKGDKIYAKVIEKINQLNPDFAVNVGDFTFDSLPRHWKDFEKITAKTRVPYLTVVGNHDVIFRRNYYESRYTPPHAETGLDDYTFDYGNSRFIMLDNANRTITERQFQWLEKLTNTTKKTFVFAHIPPAYEDWSHSLSPSKAVSKRWMDLQAKNNVDYVLLGHIHLYDEKVHQGVKYVVSGGAGSPLDKKAKFGKALYHVVQVEINGDQVSHRVVPVQTQVQSEGPTGFDTGLDSGEIGQLIQPPLNSQNIHSRYHSQRVNRRPIQRLQNQSKRRF